MTDLTFHDRIDTDRLKEFIVSTYPSVKHFANMTGVTYMHFLHCLGRIGGKEVTPLLMVKIIRAINRWYKVDKFEFKPTTEMSECYFMKRTI